MQTVHLNHITQSIVTLVPVQRQVEFCKCTAQQKRWRLSLTIRKSNPDELMGLKQAHGEFYFYTLWRSQSHFYHLSARNKRGGFFVCFSFFRVKIKARAKFRDSEVLAGIQKFNQNYRDKGSRCFGFYLFCLGGWGTTANTGNKLQLGYYTGHGAETATEAKKK